MCMLAISILTNPILMHEPVAWNTTFSSNKTFFSLNSYNWIIVWYQASYKDNWVKNYVFFCEMFGNWWVFVTYQAVSKTSATICSLAIKHFKYPANFSSYILFQSIMLKIHFILVTNQGTESFSASINWLILMWKLIKNQFKNQFLACILD